MSMPQPFNIAVISDRQPRGAELAATAAAILRSPDSESEIRPYIVATSTFIRCRLALSQAGVTRNIVIAEPVKTYLLDPKKIDLWLALDELGHETACDMVKQAGPAPIGFYRNVFPDPVVRCDYLIPDPPHEENFDTWLNFLVEHLTPWRKRFWDTFCDSS